MTRMVRAPTVVIAAAAVLSAGCGSGDEPRLRVERDTVGDTLVVRTLAGSEWGGTARLEPEVRIGAFEGEEYYTLGRVMSLGVAADGSIYIVDQQVPALRKYAPDGRYVSTFGREGGGPGEYRRPDAGLAVLPDGRVVLRDPANGRLQVYSATGEPVDGWPIRGGIYFNSENPLCVDTAGRLYMMILLRPDDADGSVAQWRPFLTVIDTETGEARDTLPVPTWDYERPRLVARRVTDDGTSMSVNDVPFTAQSHWAFSPYGYMVGGVATRYAIDQYRPDGAVVRLERRADAVPVRKGERANAEALMRWDMRRTQPDWQWNGPAIPETKPPYRGLHVGQDGRIWVVLHQPGKRIPDAEIDPPAPDEQDPRPVQRWREPVAFDVFEPDGTYLGMVRAPEGFSLRPEPVFDGDRVWAIVRDEFDVQYLTRFRVQPARG